MTFLNSILKQSTKHEFPFDHWEYDNALSEGAIEEIIKADIPDLSKHNLNYDGTRAIDGGAAEFREGIASGGKAIKFRCFVTKENAKNFPNLVKFIKELQEDPNAHSGAELMEDSLDNFRDYVVEKLKKKPVIEEAVTIADKDSANPSVYLIFD